jgi:hypothetical protein
MKHTQYFAHRMKGEDRKRINAEWILRTLSAPDRSEQQDDGRYRLWKYIPEAEKFLRVIVLADGETVHNAFFDRSFKEDCK